MLLCEASEAKKLVSLSEAAKMAPTRPNVSTLWRWCLKGILSPKGERIRLQHIRCGRAILTNAENLEVFFKKLAEVGVEQFEA
jgi:hypothetical protein